MARPNCTQISKTINHVKILLGKYNVLFPLFPENEDECLKLKDEIESIVEDIKEVVRIKWADYKRLDRVELQQTPDMMNDVVITSDDKVVTISGNCITIYNAKTGRRDKQFRGSKESFTALTELDNGLFATGGEDGLLRIWDTKGKLQRVLKGHSEKEGTSIQRIMQLSDKTIVSVGNSFDGFVIVWDIEKGEDVRRIRQNVFNPNNFEFDVFKLGSDKIAITCGKNIEVLNTETYESKAINLTENKDPLASDFGEIIAVNPISQTEVEIFFSDRGNSLILNFENHYKKEGINPVRPDTQKIYFTSDHSQVIFSDGKGIGSKVLEFVDMKKRQSQGHYVDSDVRLIKETKDHKIITIEDRRRISVWGIPEEREEEDEI